MWHSEVIGLVATTMAHEMGHNFGMEHDTENCDCPDDRCIMSPASSTMRPSFWSSCSLEYLALAFEHGQSSSQLATSLGWPNLSLLRCLLSQLAPTTDKQTTISN